MTASTVERGLQQEVMWRLRSYPVVAVPVPNGVWIPARSEHEKALVARIIARMKTDGAMLPGAPDLACIWPSGGGFVELKRPAHRDLFGYHAAGTASEDQLVFAQRCRKLGINHAFARSWEELRQHLADWGALP